MKICIFSHTFPRFTGDTAAPFMSNLAEAFARVDHDVIVLLPFDNQLDIDTKYSYIMRSYRYIIPDQLHQLGYSRTLQGDRSLRLGAYALSPLLFFFGFLALLRLVREEKIDVISAHWIIPNGFIAALVSKLTGIPFTVTIPGSDVYLGGKNAFFKWMVGFAARNAAVVLADSSYYLEQLLRLGFSPKKTGIIRYGVDTKKFKPIGKDKEILKNFNLSARAPIIVAVGRLVPKKGFIYLIDAMPDILKKVPSAKLILVGDGDQKRDLQNKVKQLRLEGNVIFTGTILYTELIKYYNLGDAFVMPSIKDERGNIDASPVAMMEAMACGTPVVATKFSGSDDVVENGKTGYLVPEKNCKAIAQAIIQLLNAKKESLIRSKVRKAAVEKFSTESVAQKYTEIFRFAILQK